MINEALVTLDNITQWAPASSCIRLQMLRLDKLHPVVSGNKWFKLKHHAAMARSAGKSCLLTFGGGYSNHLIATAFAAKEWGFQSIGVVRGAYSGDRFTDTLRACETYGMRLIFLNKAEYAGASDHEFSSRFPDAFIVPEGGCNEAGIEGAAEIADFLPKGITDVCVAMGSGTTLNGLYSALPAHVRLHGFYVAKDFDTAESRLRHPGKTDKPQVFLHPVADPRFGKWTESALEFIRAFKKETGIPLDVVYTSKMMMKVRGMLANGEFQTGCKITCIHTGGLQGNPAALFK